MSHCFPWHSWCGNPNTVPETSEDLRVRFSRIILPGTSRKERGLLHPLYLDATWDLMTIIRISMSPLGTRWEKFHRHMVRSTVSFLLIWTNPTTADSKKWHLNHAEKWSFFLDFKKLSRKLHHNFYLSEDSFFSLECFQMRNIQTIIETNIYWALTMGQVLCHVVSLNLLLLFLSTLESRYHHYPHFQMEKPWLIEVKCLALSHLASKFKNLASNPGQLKSKTYTSMIHQ